LIKSNQKSSQQKCFFVAQGLCPAKRAEPRAAKPYLHLRSLIILASGKVRNALAAAPATIVLPAFGRSLSADGERKYEHQLFAKQKKRWVNPALFLMINPKRRSLIEHH